MAEAALATPADSSLASCRLRIVVHNGTVCTVHIAVPLFKFNKEVATRFERSLITMLIGEQQCRLLEVHESSEETGKAVKNS